MKRQVSNGSSPIVRKATNPPKTVLTTGEVAKICSVAPRTVSKWFDAGQLRGYRIPGSKDRRIPLDQLVRFMRTHGMPLNGLATTSTSVVVLDTDVPLWDRVREAMEGVGDFEVTLASGSFEAGVVVKERKPSVLVVDVNLPDVVSRSLAMGIRSIPELQQTRLIAIGAGLSGGEHEALLQDGFDAALSKPFQVRELIASFGAIMNPAVPADADGRGEAADAGLNAC